MSQDVKMLYIEDDIKKIQTKTNLYLKSYGSKGAMHLAKEVIHNAVDEVIDPKSNGSKIFISYDRLEDSLTVEDNGRGFPEVDYPLDTFCTKLQSGSKFMRDNDTYSSGEFGLGLTAVCALSDKFVLISYRSVENYSHRIEFENGEKIKDTKESLIRGGKKHGVYVKFIPSKKFLGPTTRIDSEELESVIDDISYQLTDNIVIEYTLRDGLDVISERTFKKKDPITLLEKICGNDFMIKPFMISNSSEFDEFVFNLDQNTNDATTLKHRIADYSIMIAYDTNAETIYDSYCNFANTINGGSHVEAAESTYCRYLQLKTKESLSDREKQKIDILWSDVRDHLKMVVMLTTNANVEFIGNTKEKVGSKTILKVMKEGLNSAIENYFNKNPSLLKDLIRVVKTNAKVRTEANKIREASAKEVMTSLKEHQEDNFIRCSNTGKEYKELMMMEGKSPQGGAANARDTRTQAILAFRGVTANAYKASLEELMNPQTGNVELRRLVRVLRCGIGPTFNLNNLYYNKIIIFTDADIDGSGISAGLAGFFVRYLPEIVEAGKLYKVVPPLYKLEDKKGSIYVRTKKEMVEVYQDRIIKSYRIIILKYSSQFIDKQTFEEFLYNTRDYLKELERIGNHFRANMFLIEKIIAFILYKFKSIDDNFEIKTCFSDQSFVTEIMSYIQEDFPEMKLSGEDNKVLSGVIDGRFQSILLSNRFTKKCKPIFQTIINYGYGVVVQENGASKVQMSIGKFLQMTQKYVPKILLRYKGIGEMAAEDLMETTMNPNTRMLIRLTIDDLKKDIKIFEKLFGESAKNKEDRKKMMNEYIISRDDLDN